MLHAGLTEVTCCMQSKQMFCVAHRVNGSYVLHTVIRCYVSHIELIEVMHCAQS